MNQIVVIGALMLVCTLAAPAPPVLAQAEAPWPVGMQVSQGGGQFYEPRLAFDDEGFAHLAFFGGESQDAWSIFYTSNRGGSFAPPRLISVARGNQQLGDIAVGPDGHVHVVYQRGADGEVYHVESPDRGETWGAPSNLSRSPGRAFEPAIAVDEGGGLHAVWIDTRWTGVVGLTYATRLPGASGFGAPQRIGLPQFESAPALVASGTGPDLRLHIVYQGRPADDEDNGGFDIFYVAFAQGQFAPPRSISNDRNVWSLTPTIAADTVGTLFLAWDADVGGQHDVVLTRSLDQGASWSPPVNVAQTPLASLFPRLAAGVDRAGRRQIHIVWSEEGVVGGKRILYRRFEPEAERFSDVQQASSRPESFRGDVGASAVNEQFAVAYHAPDPSTQVFVSQRGFGAVVSARVLLEGGAAATTRRTLAVTLERVLGEPTRMRYALGRPPGPADPWLPLQTSFTLVAPTDGQCRYTLYLQLDAPDGRISKALPATIAVDSEVQATIVLQGAAYHGSNGDPAFTNQPAYRLIVANAGECNRLTRLLAAGVAQPFDIDNRGFDNILALPGPLADGARPVTVRVHDSVGNQRSLTRQITLDTRPPELLSGTLKVATPAAGLSLPETELRVDGLSARDNLYPNGYWGLLVALSADPGLADDSPELRWHAVQLRPDETGGAVARNWSLRPWASGLPGGTTLAGQDVQVRARLIDGAGNASPQVLTSTLRLAEDFRAPGLWVPLVAR